MTTRIPPVFISHGSPALFFEKQNDAHIFLKQQLLNSLGIAKPKAVVCVSAHWEEDDQIAVTTGAAPSQIYDFGGFPKELYEFKYPVKGSPILAQRVISLISGQGIPVRGDPKRGFDHGVWSPLSITFPQADVPFVQVSLHADLSPSLHMDLGKALSPLQYENVLIVASGSSVHNIPMLFRASAGQPVPAAFGRFENHLQEIVTQKVGGERRNELKKLYQHPDSSISHPSFEHLAPIFVAAGAGENMVGRLLHQSNLGGQPNSFFAF